tara:strand:+ start:297 stop:677 length:381 start_codon:yes stop_codon:yes gene_type:complete
MNSLASDIKIYLELSESIKEKEKTIRERKKKKNNLEKKIISDINKYYPNTKSQEFKLDKYNIRYETSQKKSDLSQKLIKSSLQKYFNYTYGNRLSSTRCEEKANEIFEFILNERDTKEISSLKYSV